MKITTDELFDLLRNETDGKFFSVTFQRRTTRPNRSARAGELRTMLCRTAGTMSAYKLGRIPDAVRDAEDLRTGTLTVWSMDSYMRMRRMEWTHANSAWNAWRRIDLMGIRECSLVTEAELPPTYRPTIHEVHNLFRLHNMPPIAR